MVLIKSFLSKTHRLIIHPSSYRNHQFYQCFTTEIKNEENKRLADHEMAQSKRTVLPIHASEDLHVINPAGLPNVDAHPEYCAVLNRVEPFYRGRKVIISRPTKNAMQSGIYNTLHIEMRFCPREKWTNPLMGWTSSADPFSNLVIKFDTREEAISFAKRQGFKVEEEKEESSSQHEGELSYAYNFLPRNVATMIEIEGKKVASEHFSNRTGKKSTFIKTLKYHGDGVVAQHGGDV